MDYFNYKEYTLDQLYDARRNIDREKYPNRFADLEKEIKTKESSPELLKEVPSKKGFEKYKKLWRRFWSSGVDQEKNSSTAPPGLEFIKLMYVIFASLGIIVLILTIGIAAEGNFGPSLRILFFTSMSWLIFYGMNKIKSWVVPVILIYASFSFIASSLNFYLFRIDSISGIFHKVFYGFFVFFYAYQIYVFSRSNTRKYFKERGKFLIS